MNCHDEIRDRFLRDPVAVRLGGLAANLARVSSFSDAAEGESAVQSLVIESRRFIEWTADDLDPDTRARLAEIERELAGWERSWDRNWSDPEARTRIAHQAAAWSDEILTRSGLRDG